MEREFREDCYASAETSLRGLTLFYPSPLTSVLLYKSYIKVPNSASCFNVDSEKKDLEPRQAQHKPRQSPSLMSAG